MKRDKIQTLREDVVIPDVVLKKAEDAFDLIRAEEKQNTVKKDINTDGKRRRAKMHIKRIVILAAAAVLAFGTVGFAYYVKWARGFENELHVTEEIKTQAAETKLADFPEQSVTCGNVTVTAKQSIVDNYYAYLSFEVKGYELPDGAEPGFGSVGAIVGGESVTFSASFYDGIITGEDGRPVYEDGTPLQSDEDVNLTRGYKAEDGTLEYHINLASNDEEGYFLNKPIHVELKNLGIYPGKAEPVEPAVEGEWVFDWILQGSDEIYKADCNETLGDTGVTVTGAEISPISIKAIYDAPRQIITEPAVNETTGEAFTYETYAEPPALAGVKMKDGTLYPYLYMGPGLSGYTDENSSRYVEMFAVDRILDVNQVEALLFRKDGGAYENGADMEDNFYAVDIR